MQVAPSIVFGAAAALQLAVRRVMLLWRAAAVGRGARRSRVWRQRMGLPNLAFSRRKSCWPSSCAPSPLLCTSTSYTSTTTPTAPTTLTTRIPPLPLEVSGPYPPTPPTPPARSSWRAMVAPIRATTGINTKLLTALELGIPLVVTPAAAAPLSLRNTNVGTADGSASDGGETAGGAEVGAEGSGGGGAGGGGGGGGGGAGGAVVLIADSASDIVASVLRVYTNAAQWKRLAIGSRHAFREMLQNDPSADDMRSMLAATCVARYGAETKLQRELVASADVREGGSTGWTELRYATAGGLSGNRSFSRCYEPPLSTWDRLWGRANGAKAPKATSNAVVAATEEGPSRPALLVVASQGPLAPYAASTLHRIWWRLCRYQQQRSSPQDQHCHLHSLYPPTHGGAASAELGTPPLSRPELGLGSPI